MESKPDKRRRRVAGWIGFPGITLWGVLRFLEWLFTLGGTSGNIEGWREMGLVILSATPSWLMPSLFAGASVAVFIYLVGVVPELYVKYRENMMSATSISAHHVVIVDLVTSAVVVLAGIIVTVIVVSTTSYFSPPVKTWTHSTLSSVEQERALAACKIAAYDAIGGGTGSLRDRTAWHRATYVNQCMTVKGFQLTDVEVPED